MINCIKNDKNPSDIRQSVKKTAVRHHTASQKYSQTSDSQSKTSNLIHGRRQRGAVAPSPWIFMHGTDKVEKGSIATPP